MIPTHNSSSKYFIAHFHISANNAERTESLQILARYRLFFSRTESVQAYTRDIFSFFWLAHLFCFAFVFRFLKLNIYRDLHHSVDRVEQLLCQIALHIFCIVACTTSRAISTTSFTTARSTLCSSPKPRLSPALSLISALLNLHSSQFLLPPSVHMPSLITIIIISVTNAIHTLLTFCSSSLHSPLNWPSLPSIQAEIVADQQRKAATVHGNDVRGRYAAAVCCDDVLQLCTATEYGNFARRGYVEEMSDDQLLAKTDIFEK